jgi:hypothetical protein
MVERFDGAQRDIKRALELDPGNANALEQRNHLPWHYRLLG